MKNWFKWIETWLNKRMAKKISALPPASIPLVGGERVALVQSGTTVQAAISSLSANGGGSVPANIAFTNVRNTFTTGQVISGPLTATRASLSGLQLGSNVEIRANGSNFYVGNVNFPSGNMGSTGQYNIVMGLSCGRAITGDRNIVMGYKAGQQISTGRDNVFLGSNAGLKGEFSINNVGIGYNAAQHQRSGSGVISIGYNAGRFTEGSSNSIHIGSDSGVNAYNGGDNIYIGRRSGAQDVGNVNVASQNVFLGRGSGEFIVDGRDNVAVGTRAGANLHNSYSNVMIGKHSGLSSLATRYNVMLGAFAGVNATSDNGHVIIGGYSSANAQRGTTNIGYRTALSASAFYTTLLGFKAGELGSTPSYATFVGAYAGRMAFGQFNSFFGFKAGQEIKAGAYSVLAGSYAGQGFVAGNNNILIGHRTQTATPQLSTISNAIVLGSRAVALSSGEFVLGSTTNPLLTNTPTATPATPFTFLQIRLNGQQLKIPLYT